MKFRTRDRRKLRATLDLTSLVDVVLLLILFFMLSSTFAIQSSIPVELPRAEGSTQFESRDLSVTLTSTGGSDGKGGIFVDNTPVADMKELANVLAARHARDPRMLVLIRADAGVPTGRTVEVLSVAYSAGITRSLIAARPPEETP